MPFPIGFPSAPGYGSDYRDVGETTMSAVNLEQWPNPKWLLLDGRDLNRSDVQELANGPDGLRRYPAGVFTSIARTLAASPTAANLVTDGTTFLAPGAAGTDALQASTDFITWVTTTGVWTAATAFPAMTVTALRYVIAPSAGESVPYFILKGATAANVVVKANWTATTSAAGAPAVTALTEGLSSCTVSGVGRAMLIVGGAVGTATGAMYLADGTSAWIAATGGSTMTRGSITWDGTKTFVFQSTSASLYQTSTDGGATYVDAYLPFQCTVSSSVSDGKGIVIAHVTALYVGGGLNQGAGFIVTTDGGVSWSFQDTLGLFDLSFIATGVKMNYTNGKFFAFSGSTQGYVAITVDGRSWSAEPITGRGLTSILEKCIIWKANVYGMLTSGSTAGLSATENMAKLKLQMQGTRLVTAAGYVKGSPSREYIKARSN